MFLDVAAPSRLFSVMDNTMILMVFFFTQIAQTTKAEIATTVITHTTTINTVLPSPKYKSLSGDGSDISRRMNERKKGKNENPGQHCLNYNAVKKINRIFPPMNISVKTNF